jgi:hypothetical protein
MSFTAISLIGMTVLLAWALFNIAGAINTKAYRRKQADVRGYFWQMSGMWGVINAVIAGSALLGIIRASVVTQSQKESQIGIIGFNVIY